MIKMCTSAGASQTKVVFLGESLGNRDVDEIEENEILSSIKKNDKQNFAVNEKGKRIFRGAFTGGFSAGFFNTVDTKQGWAPSSFRSSRSDRILHTKQKIEEFMDEEDTQDNMINLKVRNEFALGEIRRGAEKKFASFCDETKTQKNSHLFLTQLILQPLLPSIGLEFLKLEGMDELKKKPKNNFDRKNRFKQNHKVRLGPHLPSHMQSEFQEKKKN